jgi:hypothetical protein
MGGLLKARIASSITISVLVAMCFMSAAEAACYPPESRLSSDKIRSFLSNPAELLANNPSGGDELVSAIRNLVASDEATLPIVIKLLRSRNPQQLGSIGSGLALASRVCLGTGLEADQIFAGNIQSQLAATGFGVAMTAFVTDGGQDTPTAATGAGAPSATAFVSGVFQVTGTFRNVDHGPPVLPLTPPTTTSFSSFTFTTTGSPRSSNRPVSQ